MVTLPLPTPPSTILNLESLLSKYTIHLFHHKKNGFCCPLMSYNRYKKSINMYTLLLLTFFTCKHRDPKERPTGAWSWVTSICLHLVPAPGVTEAAVKAPLGAGLAPASSQRAGRGFPNTFQIQAQPQGCRGMGLSPVEGEERHPPPDAWVCPPER